MCQHEHKHCPLCNNRFECKAGSILLCQCIKIEMGEQERNFITEQYQDCLCAACLKEIKADFHRNQFAEKLKRVSVLLKDLK